MSGPKITEQKKREDNQVSVNEQKRGKRKTGRRRDADHFFKACPYGGGGGYPPLRIWFHIW